MYTLYSLIYSYRLNNLTLIIISKTINGLDMFFWLAINVKNHIFEMKYNTYEI